MYIYICVYIYVVIMETHWEIDEALIYGGFHLLRVTQNVWLAGPAGSFLIGWMANGSCFFMWNNDVKKMKN